jgi:hypothetical protein
MVHAKNAVAQEILASTLQDYKIPMVPWKIYNAAKEVDGMESGLKAFKEAVAKIALSQQAEWSISPVRRRTG